MGYRVLRTEIQNRMDKLGWSQEVLAEESGISVRQIGRILRGDTDSSPKTLLKLATALQIKVIEEVTNSAEKSAPDSGRPTIAIVGMGFAGTCTAIRLMELTSTPLRLCLIEKRKEFEFGGLVYSSNSLGSGHFLNIHAGRISLFRERPDDFLKWATEDADRSKWNTVGCQSGSWDSWKAYEHSAVPRKLYHLYLKDRYRLARDRSALEGLVDVESVNDTVVDLEHKADSVILQTSEAGPIDADAVMLCTGHTTVRTPEFISQHVEESENYYEHPYSPGFVRMLKNADVNSHMLVIGSGLTAYDAIISALDNKYPGRLTVVSRHGLVHKSYPEQHFHAIRPSIFTKNFRNADTAEKMVKAISRSLIQGEETFGKQFREDDRRVIPERVYKAIEPEISRFVSDENRVPTVEVQKFLWEWRSWITTNRTSVVPEVARRVENSGAEFLAGSISQFTLRDDGQYHTTILSGQSELEADFSHVVCCTGFEADFSKVGGLWKRLLAKETAIPHRRTGLGIEVGKHGKVLNGKENAHANSVYAVGTMRQGDEIQRRGRLGAFTFSIGTIRNQALTSALSVLKQLENRKYSALSNTKRKPYQRGISEVTNKRKFHECVNAINDIQFQPKSLGREIALTSIRDRVQQLVVPVSEDRRYRKLDAEILNHCVWHSARLQAGRIATDISRLSERHAKVWDYRPGSSNECHREKKDCKDQLKLLMHRIKAKAVSASIFDSSRQCLFPFVSHLRLNVASKTAYGEHNAGRLLKGYVERTPFEDLFPEGFVDPFSINERLVGILIPDYNKTAARKPQIGHRYYENVLVALVFNEGVVVGAVYFEAPLMRAFNRDDMEVVIEGITDRHVPLLLSSAVESWDQLSDDNHQHEVLNNQADLELSWEESNLSNASLQESHFRRADFSRSIIYGTKFNSTVIDNGSFCGAQIFGADFADATLSGIDFAGATIKACNFRDSIMTEVHFEGAFLEGCIFEHCDLSGSFWAGAKVRKNEFAKSDLTGSDFRPNVVEDCSLEEAILHEVKTDRRTIGLLSDTELPSTFTYVLDDRLDSAGED